MLDRELVEVTRQMFERAVRESGAWISADQRVQEETAATLIGMAKSTLIERRQWGTGPKHFRLGGGGHRFTYSLIDLALWVISHRTD